MITDDGKDIPITPYEGPVPLEAAVLRDREIVAALRARIAALKKCIEARKSYISHLGGCDCSECYDLRAAIRRADEEAGRSKPAATRHK